MTKAKYKLGSMLETETSTAKVTAVIQKEKGYQYELGGGMIVNEDEVLNAYRPQKARATKTVKPKAQATGKKKPANTQAQASV